MQLSTGWTQLNAALKTLRERWHGVRGDWDDAVRRDFEEHLWKPLEAQVVATLRAIDRLAPVLDKARRDCGE